jgi:hypothetical protein
MIRRKTVLRLFVVFLAGLACGSELPKYKLPTLEDLRNRSQLEIKGAKVSKAQDARNLAEGEYLEKLLKTRAGMLANEGASDISIATLGFDVPEFGKTGDKIWEVRIALHIKLEQDLRAIAWIHPQTGKVHFVIGPWQVDKSAVLEIKGAKISSTEEAQKLAFKAYAEKMKLNKSDTEAPGDVSALILGFEIPDFGKSGDKIYEVQISNTASDGTRTLRGVLWINTETETIYYVIGPWEPEKTK